jgi:hypothetical protein
MLSNLRCKDGCNKANSITRIFLCFEIINPLYYIIFVAIVSDFFLISCKQNIKVIKNNTQKLINIFVNKIP